MKVLLSLALMMATACLGELHSLFPSLVRARINTPSGTVCRGPPDSGRCLGYSQRYYYSVESDSCIGFIYGLCGGNKNNFGSVEECQETCSSKTDVCQLPQKTGPCKASLTRYFFNDDSQECERFTYGGCEGNANNFLTKRDCKERCDSVVRSSSSESDSESEMPKEKDGVAGKASKLIKKPLSELKALKTRRKFALGQKVEQAEATDAKPKYTFLEECCHEAPCSKEEVVELAASGQDLSREMKKYHWCRP